MKTRREAYPIATAPPLCASPRHIGTVPAWRSARFVSQRLGMDETQTKRSSDFKSHSAKANRIPVRSLGRVLTTIALA